MKTILLLISAGSLWAQFPTDSRGIIVTGLPAAQDSLIGPLIPHLASPWIYSDLAEKGTADNMAPAAIAEAPALGTACPGTVSFTSGDDIIYTTSDLTTCLSGQSWVAVVWDPPGESAGTGRLLCPLYFVNAAAIFCSEHEREPSFSGATAYKLPAADITGCDFQCWSVENPNQSWNYYDVAIGLYRLYYRTGDTTYRTYARTYADIQWQWVIDHGYRPVAPRAASLISQFFRALDGHSERFPGLYNLISIYHPSFATYEDKRESGYVFWDVALGAKTDPDATRHAQYCSWLATDAAYWNSIQYADGSWGQNEYAINQTYVNAPKSYTLPIQHQSSPWRTAINIKGLEAAYESLTDTTAQGCNLGGVNTALAATVLSTITKAVTWQNNYGRDTASRGAFYEVNSLSQDNTILGGTGTVDATRTSANIVGHGTNWLTAGYCDGTHFIGIRGNNTVYQIASCPSNTAAVLTVPYGFFSEGSDVAGVPIEFAQSSSTGCHSLATRCYGPDGDRNLTRTICGGEAWLYAQTLNPIYRTWSDECVSATLGGPTAGLTIDANVSFFTLPCTGPACDGYVGDSVYAAAQCGVAPCIYANNLYGNQGKNFGETWGAPGIDNALAWRLFGTPSGPAIPAKSIFSGKSIVP